LIKRGFSFIEYKYPEHAQLAVKKFDGQMMGEKQLRVERSSKNDYVNCNFCSAWRWQETESDRTSAR